MSDRPTCRLTVRAEGPGPPAIAGEEVRGDKAGQV